MSETPETDPSPLLDLLIWRLAEANRVVIETPNALGLADAHYMPAKPILDALVWNRGRIKALEAENERLRAALAQEGDN